MDLSWVSRDLLLDAVKPYLKPAHVLLDIGCGIRPQLLIEPTVHICVDPFAPYLEKIERKPNRVLLCAPWDRCLRLFPEGSVDAIYLLDVIEHCPKQIARAWLSMSVDLAKSQVVVFTPYGFLAQEGDAWGLGGGEYQRHISGWEPKDFPTGWKFIAANAFHGPHGAFWALKTK